MKSIQKLFLASFALLATAVALVAKPIPGPKGGRVVTTDAPHVEFLVEKDRSVVVSFYDKDLKPITAGTQVVSATAEAKSGKVKLAFTPKEGALVSSAPLPEGDNYTVVLQVRDTPEAKPKNYRVLLNDMICAECQRAEYACTCDEAGGEAHKP